MNLSEGVLQPVPTCCSAGGVALVEGDLRHHGRVRRVEHRSRVVAHNTGLIGQAAGCAASGHVYGAGHRKSLNRVVVGNTEETGGAA